MYFHLLESQRETQGVVGRGLFFHLLVRFRAWLQHPVLGQASCRNRIQDSSKECCKDASVGS